MAVRRSEEAYADLLHKLMPPGVAWPESGVGNFAAIWAAFSVQLAEVDSRVCDLLAELDPTQAFEMLEEWESDLGLPEKCRVLSGPTSERRQDILSKLASEEAYNSRQWLIDLAAAVGFTITITEFDPSEFQVGLSAVGDPIEPGWYRQIFQVNAALTTVRPFETGHSSVGDALLEFGNELLECVIRNAMPAHVQVIFAYT